MQIRRVRFDVAKRSRAVTRRLGGANLRTQLLERCRGEGEVIESPLHLYACQGLVAKFAHGRAQCLRGEEAVQHAPDPVRRADIPFWTSSLAPSIDVFQNLLDEGEVGT